MTAARLHYLAALVLTAVALALVTGLIGAPS